MPLNPLFTLIDVWHAPSESGRPDVASLLPHEKLLLLSDGSLTLELELISGAAVSVDVLNIQTTGLPEDYAQYLMQPAGVASLNRTVWLKARGEFLVFAHTVIPESCVEADLKKTLDERSKEPIGKVLADKKIFFSKERLQIGAAICREAARALGLAENHAFSARRYILSGVDSNGGSLIKASLVEIFSPSIVPCAQA